MGKTAGVMKEGREGKERKGEKERSGGEWAEREEETQDGAEECRGLASYQICIWTSTAGRKMDRSGAE